ncbi:MAG: hypothetical protein VYA80_05875 [Pseudomonadota bacterium]|nr:hypothetical protein [Pseudomonadota bacterium]
MVTKYKNIPSGPRPLSELISKNQTNLGKLAIEAKRRENLNNYLLRKLPSSISKGISHCNINPEDTITILTPSTEWASKLRFNHSKILEISKKKEPKVKRIKFRVKET